MDAFHRCEVERLRDVRKANIRSLLPKICVRLQTDLTTCGIPAARGGKWSALQYRSSAFAPITAPKCTGQPFQTLLCCLCRRMGWPRIEQALLSGNRSKPWGNPLAEARGLGRGLSLAAISYGDVFR